jgi:hypothetical protein
MIDDKPPRFRVESIFSNPHPAAGSCCAPPLGNCALIHSSIRKDRPRVPWDPASSTSVHNRDNASSRPAVVRNLGDSR